MTDKNTQMKPENLPKLKFYMNLKLKPQFTTSLYPKNKKNLNDSSTKQIELYDKDNRQRQRVQSFSGGSNYKIKEQNLSIDLSRAEKSYLSEWDSSFLGNLHSKDEKMSMFDQSILSKSNTRNHSSGIQSLIKNKIFPQSMSSTPKKSPMLQFNKYRFAKLVPLDTKSLKIPVLSGSSTSNNLQPLNQQKFKNIAQVPASLVKVFFLNRISEFKEIKSNFIDINILPFFYSNFKKEVHHLLDQDIFSKLSSLLSKLLSPTYFVSQNSNNIYKFTTKEELVKFLNDYDNSLITEEQMRDTIYHYFIPNQKYREQILCDFVTTINIKGNATLEEYTPISLIFDVEGTEVKELLQLSLSTRVLLAGDILFNNSKKMQFLNEMQEFMDKFDNFKFKDNLKQKAFSTFNTQIYNSKSPFDSPRQQRSSRNPYEDSLLNFEGEIQKKGMSFSKIPQAPLKLDSFRKKTSVSIPHYQKDDQMNSNVNGIDTSELNRIKQIFPQLQNKEIFRYYSEFSSLMGLNAKYESNFSISSIKDVFGIYAVNYFQFCTSFDKKRHFNIMMAIIKALGLDVNDHTAVQVKLNWDQFLLARVMTEQRGEDHQVLDFIERLLDPLQVGQISKSMYMELLQSKNDIHLDSKIYPHQMWNYFKRFELVNEDDQLIVSKFKSVFKAHFFSFNFFLSWILSNFDESLEEEINQTQFLSGEIAKMQQQFINLEDQQSELNESVDQEQGVNSEEIRSNYFFEEAEQQQKAESILQSFENIYEISPSQLEMQDNLLKDIQM